MQGPLNCIKQTHANYICCIQNRNMSITSKILSFTMVTCLSFCVRPFCVESPHGGAIAYDQQSTEFNAKIHARMKTEPPFFDHTQVDAMSFWRLAVWWLVSGWLAGWLAGRAGSYPALSLLDVSSV